MKNKYWDIDSIKMFDKKVEEFLLSVNKGPTKLNLHKHSRHKRKYPKLEKNKEYFIDTSQVMEAPKYERCKITYIRNGVVFYKINGKPENHFEEFSLMHYFAEPVELSVNLDSKYYQIISRSGMMKVNYLVKLK